MCVRACVRVYVCTCVRVRMCVRVCVCVYIYLSFNLNAQLKEFIIVLLLSYFMKQLNKYTML